MTFLSFTGNKKSKKYKIEGKEGKKKTIHFTVLLRKKCVKYITGSTGSTEERLEIIKNVYFIDKRDFLF